MRCNGAAVGTFLSLSSRMPPPADRRRYPTKKLFRTILILSVFAVLSLAGGSMLFPMPRLDNTGPIIIGSMLALVGSYLAADSVDRGWIFLAYAGLCSILWVPYYIAYVRSMSWLQPGSQDGNGPWIGYCVYALCFMLTSRFIAYFRFNPLPAFLDTEPTPPNEPTGNG